MSVRLLYKKTRACCSSGMVCPVSVQGADGDIPTQSVDPYLTLSFTQQT
jgi:hypothetical protein